MFSGIIEARARMLSWEPAQDVVRLKVERPSTFADLHLGDSISTNGICLTVESITDAHIQFALGPETLRLLEISPSDPKRRGPLLHPELNLERSLAFGARMHGHLVTGHAEGLARLIERTESGESLTLAFLLPLPFGDSVIQKGSIAFNGVSLTVNSVSKERRSESEGLRVEVCLIPETLLRTNLGLLQVGDVVTFETDYMRKMLLQIVNGRAEIPTMIFKVNVDSFSPSSSVQPISQVHLNLGEHK